MKHECFHWHETQSDERGFRSPRDHGKHLAIWAKVWPDGQRVGFPSVMEIQSCSLCGPRTVFLSSLHPSRRQLSGRLFRGGCVVGQSRREENVAVSSPSPSFSLKASEGGGRQRPSGRGRRRLGDAAWHGSGSAEQRDTQRTEAHKTHENLTTRLKPDFAVERWNQRRARGVEWTRWGETRRGCQCWAVDESTQGDGPAIATWTQESVPQSEGAYVERTRVPRLALSDWCKICVSGRGQSGHHTHTVEKNALKTLYLRYAWTAAFQRERRIAPGFPHENNGHDWSPFLIEIGSPREDKRNRGRENMQDYFGVVARAGIW